MQKLAVDNEFQSLIPKLSNDEYNGLEESIMAEGCRDALVVWNNAIIDGHNRYEICQKHNLPFDTTPMCFESRDDAKIWIIDNQRHRRNISKYDNGILSLKKKDILAKKAKENQVLAGKLFGEGHPKEDQELMATLPKALSTREQLAKEAGMSGRTLDKIEKIEAVATDEVKGRVKANEVSINEAYKKIRKEDAKAEAMSARERKASEAKQNKVVLSVDFRLGDFREVLADIPDNSIDLILTDPPYPEEYLPLWEDLAIFAKRVLKHNRFLIAYSGQLHLNKVYALLSKHLDYYWTFNLLHQGNNQLINARNIFCNWKPLLIFQNGFKKIDVPIDDIIQGSGREKADHDWQQGESELTGIIEKFTIENEVILDPFAGSGTTLSATKKLKRQSIGAEINDQSYWIAYNNLQSLE